VEAIAWPSSDVGPDVLERWKDDESVCLRRGLYRTQLVAIGDDVERWNVEDLEVIREVFRLAGWRINGLRDLRGLDAVKLSKRPPRKRVIDHRYMPTVLYRGGVVYRNDVPHWFDESRKKMRGRRPKTRPAEGITGQEATELGSKRKPGRPRKVRVCVGDELVANKD